MTLADIRTLAKIRSDENALGAQWTAGEWTTLINAAYDSLYNKVVNVDPNNSFLTATANINWVNGTREYALPTGTSRIVRVERVRTEGNYEIDEIRLPDKDWNEGVWSALILDRSVVYYLIGSSIGFMPTPTLTETGAVKVYYIPNKTALVAESDVPVLPADCHEILAVGAARRAKSSKDLPVQDLMIEEAGLYADLVSTIINRSQASNRHTHRMDDENTL